MRLIDADALLYDIRSHSASYFADDFAREWVDKQPTVNEWIPVSEVLPMNLVLVLVTYIDEDVNYPTVDIGYHTSRGFCDRDFNVIDNVLAWKKLPKPYEVEK